MTMLPLGSFLCRDGLIYPSEASGRSRMRRSDRLTTWMGGSPNNKTLFS